MVIANHSFMHSKMVGLVGRNVFIDSGGVKLYNWAISTTLDFSLKATCDHYSRRKSVPKMNDLCDCHNISIS